MFANTGLSYVLGIFGGGIYGLNEGLKNTPSNKFKVKVNSVLNHCSRHGSRIGNVAGVLHRARITLCFVRARLRCNLSFA